MADNDYNINLDVRYENGEIIDIWEVVDGCKEKWFNQTLTKVNDSVVRIGIVHGTFHWHKHDNDDEFFFVLEGELYLDFEDNNTLVLKANQGTTVSKGIMHRPRAPRKVVMLMVETADIKPLGD